jgi:hypothetical protein
MAVGKEKIWRGRKRRRTISFSSRWTDKRFASSFFLDMYHYFDTTHTLGICTMKDLALTSARMEEWGHPLPLLRRIQFPS